MSGLGYYAFVQPLMPGSEKLDSSQNTHQDFSFQIVTLPFSITLQHTLDHSAVNHN